MSSETVRLTVGQAVVRFLAQQWSERDGVERRLVAGCLGIFGHGNVAGLGQALMEDAETDGGATLPYVPARNEQAMVHTAVGYARHRLRLSTLACTTSIGPGATNLVTGAALATVNRVPVLLLPGDVFATHPADPVLQQLEHPTSGDVTVNDALRPVSRWFDRVERPAQLPGALLAAMRVLSDPAETGAVTLALPQDVQAEAYDWPVALFAPRVWRVRRPVPDAASLAQAVEVLRAARRPLVVAGGGVRYAEASDALRAFVEATGVPVAETQAGKGALPYDHPQSVGAIGTTGTTAANTLAAEADVVLGVGTRWSDFTTASHTVFGDPDVRFVNLNVAPVDAAKNAGVTLVADARTGLEALHEALDGWAVDAAARDRATALAREWDTVVSAAYSEGRGSLLSQSQVIGVVNDVARPRDVVVCAAGSMPGELHRLWRAQDPRGYHVEYGYSCMGYEIAGGLGVAAAVRAEAAEGAAGGADAADGGADREVYVLVGDGSYLMMASELVTAVAEGVKITVVLVQNHGFASIGGLSESVGAQRFGTSARARDAATGRHTGDVLPVDLAANAASLGAEVHRAGTVDELRAALDKARASSRPTVVHVETDPLAAAPGSGAWWDVPVAAVSEVDSTRAARDTYEKARRAQRPYL